MICNRCGAALPDDSKICHQCGQQFVSAPAPVQQAPTHEVLLARAFIFLEDKNWSGAYEYCERALDLDPYNGKAYLGKLMAEVGVSHIEELAMVPYPFGNNDNFQKVLRFGDEELKQQAEMMLEQATANQIHTQKVQQYGYAFHLMETAQDENQFYAAAQAFEVLGDFEKSAEWAAQCRSRATEMTEARVRAEQEQWFAYACQMMETAQNEQQLYAAADCFVRLGDFKNAAMLGAQCRQRAVEWAEARARAEQEQRYAYAHHIMDTAQDDQQLQAAASYFASLGDYSDAAALAEQCRQKAAELAEKRVQMQKDQYYVKVYREVQEATTETQFRRAAQNLTALGDYRNVPDLYRYCMQKADECRAAAESKRKK